jgi:hypothetical protein
MISPTDIYITFYSRLSVALCLRVISTFIDVQFLFWNKITGNIRIVETSGCERERQGLQTIAPSSAYNPVTYKVPVVESSKPVEDDEKPVPLLWNNVSIS